MWTPSSSSTSPTRSRDSAGPVSSCAGTGNGPRTPPRRRSWSRIARHEGLDAYARQTLVHTLIDEWRRPWRRENVAEVLPEASATPVDATSQIDDRDQLVRAVAQLAPRQRACVVLRFYLDTSVSDTATALGCSEGNVKRLTSDGLAALRVVLDSTEGSLT
jgi:RNA polymerase sigma factor (sigma-70 family)